MFISKYIGESVLAVLCYRPTRKSFSMRFTLSQILQTSTIVLLLVPVMLACVDACQSYYQACGRRRQCCSGLNCSRDPGARPDETYCKEGTNSHNRRNTISDVQYEPYTWWTRDGNHRSSLGSVARKIAPLPTALSHAYPNQPQEQYYY
ncbi:uncharacterized protein LOC111250248 isoform X1 [Varroa destructor]|uniref:Uncharacterized protein n=1 Tax=Varroa destructor TaxID=109461 RepID=A0A7M7MGT2_VARDE|nr:uncharacterized protein LOC111250248 isoform X1 [Varroa destructor]